MCWYSGWRQDIDTLSATMAFCVGIQLLTIDSQDRGMQLHRTLIYFVNIPVASYIRRLKAHITWLKRTVFLGFLL